MLRLAWFMRRARALRTWLFVRLRIWRGRWRRGRITVPGRLLHGLGHRTWRYGLYAPGGLNDDISAPLIVVLHGCKQRALGFAYAAGWTDFAIRHTCGCCAPINAAWPTSTAAGTGFIRWHRADKASCRLSPR